MQYCPDCCERIMDGSFDFSKLWGNVDFKRLINDGGAKMISLGAVRMLYMSALTMGYVCSILMRWSWFQ